MTEKNPTTTPDTKLDRLLKRALNGAMRHGEGVHNATPAECLKCGEAISAIHAHVAQVKREAHDIGFRRGLREVGQEVAAPGMTDLMVPPETIPDYQSPE